MFFSTDLNLPLLTPQTAIFDFLAETDKFIVKTTNHLLLIFKMYWCKTRDKGPVGISRSINEIMKIKTLENIATNDTNKLVIYDKKWGKSQSNKYINIIIEIQRIKLFLRENISAFTLGRGVVNEKLIFMAKKICCFFFFFFFFSFLFFPLICFLSVFF